MTEAEMLISINVNILRNNRPISLTICGICLANQNFLKFECSTVFYTVIYAVI